MSSSPAATATSPGSTDGAPSAAGAPHRKRNVALISGAMVADSAENGIVSGLFPVIQASLGLSTSALGILIAAGRLISVVSGPVWVFLTRYFSRRAVLGFAAGIWGIWGVVAAFSQDFWQFLILNTIAAAGFTAAHVFLPAIVGGSFPDARVRWHMTTETLHKNPAHVPVGIELRDATNFRRIVRAREAVEQANVELRDAVAAARNDGEFWAAIGAALGTTRQAACQRFGR